MKNSIAFVIAVLAFALSSCTKAPDGELYPFREEGKWGYIDQYGKVVVKPQFDLADDFVGDYAAVTLDSAMLHSYFEDSYTVEKGWFAIIDKTGKIKKNVGPYQKVSLTEDGYAIGCEGSYIGNRGVYTLTRVKDGKQPFPKLGWRIYDIDLTFDSMEEAQSDGMVVYQDGKTGLWGALDLNGEILIEPSFSRSWGILGGVWSVTDESGKNYLVDNTGTKITKQDYDTIVFHVGDGLFCVTDVKGGLYRLIDKYGNPVTEPLFDDVVDGFDKNGLLFIKTLKNDKLQYELVDKTGKTVIGPYDDLGLVEDDMILYGITDESGFKEGYLDKDGKVVISPRFTHACDFSEGLAWARTSEDEKYGYIDKTGEFVIQPAFDSADVFQKSGLAEVRVGDLYGVIDKTGKYIVDPVCTYVKLYDSGMIFFKKEGKNHYANAQGEVVCSYL